MQITYSDDAGDLSSSGVSATADADHHLLSIYIQANTDINFLEAKDFVGPFNYSNPREFSYFRPN